MKKLAIIGGGIIGMTLANYLDLTKYIVTVYDDPKGQATKASAGIISPWLSKRRNKKWYQLAKDGAAFYPKLVHDFALPQTVYHQTGTLIIRESAQLEALAELANERKQTAPEIGQIEQLTGYEVKQKLPLLKEQPALWITGGAKLDGANYLAHLRSRALKQAIRLKTGPVRLIPQKGNWTVTFHQQKETYDAIALCAGPGLVKLMLPLNYSVDIRPQKGQLLVFDTANAMSGDWPVAMLDGQSDLIPFENGKILIGATHEKDAGFDLTPTKEAYHQLKHDALPFLTENGLFEQAAYHYRVGTRAYTSDFAPFFNYLPNAPSLVVASGLGSSGLTTGPYIGFLLANYFNTGHANWSHYQKPLTNYLTQQTK